MIFLGIFFLSSDQEGPPLTPSPKKKHSRNIGSTDASNSLLFNLDKSVARKLVIPTGKPTRKPDLFAWALSWFLFIVLILIVLYSGSDDHDLADEDEAASNGEIESLQRYIALCFLIYLVCWFLPNPSTPNAPVKNKEKGKARDTQAASPAGQVEYDDSPSGDDENFPGLKWVD